MDSFYFELDERVCFDMNHVIIGPMDTEYEKYSITLIKENEFGFVLKNIALINKYKEVMNIIDLPNEEYCEKSKNLEYCSSDEEY